MGDLVSELEGIVGAPNNEIPATPAVNALKRVDEKFEVTNAATVKFQMDFVVGLWRVLASNSAKQKTQFFENRVVEMATKRKAK